MAEQLTCFADLQGHTLTKIKNIENESLIFTLTSGTQYKIFHDQDCCEQVSIVDIAGHLEDCIGSPLLLAEEVTSSDSGVPSGYRNFGTYTWTFYKLATLKGYATIRWYGTSNGLYSESVEFSML